MKKLTYKLILFSIILVSMTTTSCIKESGCTDPNGLNFSITAVIDDGSCIYGGCTDPDSKNYDPYADVDDGSCTYEGSVVFWYGESVAAELVYYGVTSLTYYLDGVIVGSSAPDIYWTGPPECGQNGSVTVEKDLGNIKSRPYSFSVRDQTNIEVWGGILNIDANICLKLELTSKK